MCQHLARILVHSHLVDSATVSHWNLGAPSTEAGSNCMFGGPIELAAAIPLMPWMAMKEQHPGCLILLTWQWSYQISWTHYSRGCAFASYRIVPGECPNACADPFFEPSYSEATAVYAAFPSGGSQIDQSLQNSSSKSEDGGVCVGFASVLCWRWLRASIQKLC